MTKKAELVLKGLLNYCAGYEKESEELSRDYLKLKEQIEKEYENQKK